MTALFRGEFEAHITVRAEGRAGVAALDEYAAARGLKFTHIVLARGRVCDQPMLTVQRAGTIAQVRDSVDDLVEEVRAAGFAVVRVKVEATPWAEGVPVRDHEAVALGPGYYFEHHLKLLLESPSEELVAVAIAHAAHLSDNARRVRPDGRGERFVTQRCRLVGDLTAQARLDALVAELKAAPYEVLSIEREFVVYDSDESIDAGWISAEGETS
ncbi:hypothetical protein [Nocardia sp. NPDC050710]|uniref:hypothetical protein n=1 Tax=Nocardia sp. NPDC050710 TaxID=3157220 RepID=UPI0033E4170C